MGSSKGKVAKVETSVTPAVAQSVDEDTLKAQEEQAEERAKRRGISSTYSRYAQANGGNVGNGTQAKLG